MGADVFFSHNSDNWSTPKDLYNFFMERGYYDPCPLYATDHQWFIDKPMFINPPYSNIDEFFDLWWSSFQFHSVGAWFLVPARTSSAWFKRLFDYARLVIFISGRLKFGGSKNPAPFPSVLIYCWGGDKREVECVYRDDLINHLRYLLDTLHLCS